MKYKKIGLCALTCLSLSACSSTPQQAQLTAPSPTTEASIPTSDATELLVTFGDEGEAFSMHLEDNDTAKTIAGYVSTTEWRLPVYSYDESDVMEYYDIPSRYVIPSLPQAFTQAQAGDVYYSDPNRIVLYYHDATIQEDYTKIGTFDATDAFINAVENNPILEGWGNQIIRITVSQ